MPPGEEGEGGGAGSVARERWKILAGALLGRSEGAAPASVRRVASFGVFAPEPSQADEPWPRYGTPDGRHWLRVRRPPYPPSARDLAGFNNTGNVCVWPSEETLAAYVVANLEAFRGKRVLELGGGMSCMAGLALAKYGAAAEVRVTDGNPKCVENVRATIERNGLRGAGVSCCVLEWGCRRERGPAAFDAVLVADCLFFDEGRDALVRCVEAHLRPRGVAYAMAPRRGDTLARFVAACRSRGFACYERERYDERVWQAHLRLLAADARYDPGLHYPILLELTRPSPKLADLL